MKKTEKQFPTLSQMTPLIPGLILAASITALSMGLSRLDIIANLGLGTLTLAIVIGIILGNTLYSRLAGACQSGILFAKQRLLRLGIILYGFNITFQQVASIGLPAIVIDILIIASTFTIACWLGAKLFKMDTQTVYLIGSGASICGAAAVMAAEPIVKANASKVAVAVATVVIFGTLSMFVYPWLYQLNMHYQWFDISQQAFGIYMGSSIHEVAQVVAAGRSISETASDAAVITKMIRVMLLAPFLLILSIWLSRNQTADSEQQSSTSQTVIKSIPWFAVLFIVVAGFNSLHLVSDTTVSWLKTVDMVFLTMAMAALGLTTHLSAIRQAGIKPLLLAAVLFIWLTIGGAAINILTHAMMS